MILPSAKIEWRNGRAFNTEYGDIYGAADGDQEVARVFHAPSNLSERMAQKRHLTVAELGFGSGLSFLNTWALARTNRCRLHYLAVEAAPLRQEDLRPALSLSAHHSLADALEAAYPPPLAGWHQRTFGNGEATLSLYLGDVKEFVEALARRQTHGVDAWFLDGFAPDRNPGMWADELWPDLAACSRPGATVATFTAAGRVRRGLSAAGFEMRRVDQRPHKRESLAGALAEGAGGQKLQTDHADHPAEVQVVGAGVAGCSIAAHLAQQGIGVVLTERADAIASGASAVVAMQHARLLADGSPLAEWRAQTYHYAAHFTRGRPGCHFVGAEQTVGPNTDEAKLRRVAQAYGPSGSWLELVEGSPPRLRFADSAVADLPTLCSNLIDHPGITCRLAAAPLDDLPTIWACGAQSTEMDAFSTLPIATVWGQIDIVRADQPQSCADIGNGYVAPFGDATVIGSTYEYTPWPVEEATASNLEGRKVAQWLERRRGARAVSRDRCPIIGRYNQSWVSTGHGSMGATSAHLGAAVICSQLLGWVPPASEAVLAMLDPHRFELRASRRSRAR